MKSTGIVRRVDELGRVVLPMELRRTLLINERDTLEIYIEGDTIVMKRYDPADIFTGETEDLVEFHGKKVSLNSIRELAAIAGISVR